MEKFLIILLLLISSHGVSAQRISRQYNNVSMAQALKELNQLQNRYTVNFIYNDLEDFRITTNIKNKSVPDAIEQLIGFYPIRMTRSQRRYHGGMHTQDKATSDRKDH